MPSRQRLNILIEVNQPAPRTCNRACAYLIYPVDQGLGTIPGDMFNHLDPIIVQEDCRDQRDASVRCEGVADQEVTNRQSEKLQAHFRNSWARAGILVPAALYQCPQIFRESWMCRSRWTSALCYGQHSRDRWIVSERNRAGEDLY